MRAVIYARVSTDDQETENQLIDLRAWATSRGFAVIETYQENASAWKDGHQKELARLVKNARLRRFDVVMVWALDRISRQGALSILEFVNRLSKYGVKILSYQEPWTDAPGELADLLFALTGWVAKMESERRSERTKAGMARTLAAGVTKDGNKITQLGRPPGSADRKQRKLRPRRPLVN